MSKVRDLRIKAALNISRLSRLSGVSRPTVEKMENDEAVRPDFHGFVIYALIDPRDGLIRYVGITDNLYSRVGSHLRELGSRTAKGMWLADLDSEGLLPSIQILEKIQVARKERRLAEERELYWIEY